MHVYIILIILTWIFCNNYDDDAKLIIVIYHSLWLWWCYSQCQKNSWWFSWYNDNYDSHNYNDKNDDGNDIWDQMKLWQR